MNNRLITIVKKKNILLSFLFVLFASFTDDNEIQLKERGVPQEKSSAMKADPVDNYVSENPSSDSWAAGPILRSTGGGGGQDDFDSGGGNENPGAYNDPTETLSIKDDYIFLCILALIYGVYQRKKKKPIEQKK